jgi:hypothetical protein
MREAGLEVNDVQRIHLGENVTRESHSIMSEDPELRIPLQLKGVFSCFPTRALTEEEATACDEYPVVWLTPDARVWNPHCDSYAAANERSFLDEEGELLYPEPKRRKLIHESENEGDVFDISVSGDQYEAAIDAAICAVNDIAANPQDDSPGVVSDDTFNFDQDDPIRANVADLSGAFNPT